MMRGVATLIVLASTFLFPWPLTVVLVLSTAPFEPLLPFAVGILADTIYYTPAAGASPLYTVLGALSSVLAVLVRNQLRTGIIR